MREPATRLPLHPTLSTHYPIELATKFCERFHNLRKEKTLRSTPFTLKNLLKHYGKQVQVQVYMCLISVIPSEIGMLVH